MFRLGTSFRRFLSSLTTLLFRVFEQALRKALGVGLEEGGRPEKMHYMWRVMRSVPCTRLLKQARR